MRIQEIARAGRYLLFRWFVALVLFAACAAVINALGGL